MILDDLTPATASAKRDHGIFMTLVVASILAICKDFTSSYKRKKKHYQVRLTVVLQMNYKKIQKSHY